MARLASKIICFCRGMVGLPSTSVFNRRSINYELDLNEGIDLALFLFGSFEPDVVGYYSRVLGNGSVAIDVGANVGAHTLRMAELCGNSGMVIAVEPTAWAFKKLMKNIALNPLLRPHIRAMQAFLGSSSDRSLPLEVCSSWPMNVSSNSKEARSEGRPYSTAGAIQTSLDELVYQNGMPKVDFLKVDVDGNEIDVLAGASETLRRFKPALVIELAPYVYPDGDKGVLKILQMLADVGYLVVRIGQRNISLSRPAEILGSIPDSGGINCLVQ